MSKSTELKSYDIFISYRHKDSSVVLNISEALLQIGVRVFLDVLEMETSVVNKNNTLNMSFGIQTLQYCLQESDRFDNKVSH